MNNTSSSSWYSVLDCLHLLSSEPASDHLRQVAKTCLARHIVGIKVAWAYDHYSVGVPCRHVNGHLPINAWTNTGLRYIGGRR